MTSNPSNNSNDMSNETTEQVQVQVLDPVVTTVPVLVSGDGTDAVRTGTSTSSTDNPVVETAPEPATSAPAVIVTDSLLGTKPTNGTSTTTTSTGTSNSTVKQPSSVSPTRSSIDLLNGDSMKKDTKIRAVSFRDDTFVFDDTTGSTPPITTGNTTTTGTTGINNNNSNNNNNNSTNSIGSKWHMLLQQKQEQTIQHQFSNDSDTNTINNTINNNNNNNNNNDTTEIDNLTSRTSNKVISSSFKSIVNKVIAQQHHNEDKSTNNTTSRTSSSILVSSLSQRTTQPKEMSDEHKRRIDLAQNVTNWILVPWSKKYRCWWGLAVLMSICTAFFETYQIGFKDISGGISLIESQNTMFGTIFSIVFYIIFLIDIIISFNLAYFNHRDDLITDRSMIAYHYIVDTKLCWIDVIGIFPFLPLALLISGHVNETNNITRYLSLLRLLRLVRMYRVYQLFDILQYNTHVSFSTVTLIRNFGFALLWSHMGACGLYYISRFYNFEDDITWIGSQAFEMPIFDQYILALYWSVVTFVTVGYGDYSPKNKIEQIFGILYMFSSMAIGAAIIGSITLLMIKKDAKTSQYRDSMTALNQYSKIHNFDRRFRKRLVSQAKLYLKHQQMTDEEILTNLPISVRRKVLRRLYLPSLVHTSLFKGLRQQFVDAILINCKVEMFNTGEDILARGNASDDLFLLIDGNVKLLDAFSDNEKSIDHNSYHGSANFGIISDYTSTHSDDDHHHHTSSQQQQQPSGCNNKIIGPGNFINEISFFTEAPHLVTVRTISPCKTLTLSQSNYKKIANEHPSSVQRILQNLLVKAETWEEEITSKFDIGYDDMSVSKRLLVLSAESERDFRIKKVQAVAAADQTSEYATESVATIHARAAVVACKDLVRIHIEKMKDQCTTRFLFAASRGNTVYISLMCDQGLDPNVTDYDKRTGLMVASMKGHTDTVLKLLHYDADPNLHDSNGTTALMEATRCGHDDIITILLKHNAILGLNSNSAAGILCQTVFDGDMVKLRRLLHAKINPNSSDYDKRTATHIAASEGNISALKLLYQYGANVHVCDRWNNTPYDEAQRVQSQPVIDFLSSLPTSSSTTPTSSTTTPTPTGSASS